MNHTPGPWKVLHDEMKVSVDISIYSEIGEHKLPKYIGRVYGQGPLSRLTGERDANAALFAAAPDLLQLFKRGLECGIFEDAPKYRKDVLKAIKKAEGRL